MKEHVRFQYKATPLYQCIMAGGVNANGYKLMLPGSIKCQEESFLKGLYTGICWAIDDPTVLGEATQLLFDFDSPKEIPEPSFIFVIHECICAMLNHLECKSVVPTANIIHQMARDYIEGAILCWYRDNPGVCLMDSSDVDFSRADAVRQYSQTFLLDNEQAVRYCNSEIMSLPIELQRARQKEIEDNRVLSMSFAPDESPMLRNIAETVHLSNDRSYMMDEDTDNLCTDDDTDTYVTYSNDESKTPPQDWVPYVEEPIAPSMAVAMLAAYDNAKAPLPQTEENKEMENKVVLAPELVEQMRDYGFTPIGEAIEATVTDLQRQTFEDVLVLTSGNGGKLEEYVTFSTMGDTFEEDGNQVVEAVYEFEATSLNLIDRHINRKLKVFGDVSVRVCLNIEADVYGQEPNVISMKPTSTNVTRIDLVRDNAVVKTVDAPELELDFCVIGYNTQVVDTLFADDVDEDLVEEAEVVTEEEVIAEVEEAVAELEPVKEKVETPALAGFPDVDRDWQRNRIKRAGATATGDLAPLPEGEGIPCLEHAFVYVASKSGMSANIALPFDFKMISGEERASLNVCITSITNEQFERHIVGTLGGKTPSDEYVINVKFKGAIRVDEDGIIFEADSGEVTSAATRNKIRAKEFTSLGEKGLEAMNEHFSFDLLGYNAGKHVPADNIEIVDETPEPKAYVPNVVAAGEVCEVEDGLDDIHLRNAYLKIKPKVGKNVTFVCAPFRRTALVDGSTEEFVVELTKAQDAISKPVVDILGTCKARDFGYNVIVTGTVNKFDDGVAIVPVKTRPCIDGIENPSYTVSSLNKFYTFEFVGYDADRIPEEVEEVEEAEFTFEEMVTSTGGTLTTDTETLKLEEDQVAVLKRLHFAVEANQINPRKNMHVAAKANFVDYTRATFEVDLSATTDVVKSVSAVIGGREGYIVTVDIDYLVTVEDGQYSLSVEDQLITDVKLFGVTQSCTDEFVAKLNSQLDFDIIGYNLEAIDYGHEDEEDAPDEESVDLFELDLMDDVLTEATDVVDEELATELGVSTKKEDPGEEDPFFGEDQDWGEFIDDSAELIRAIAADEVNDEVETEATVVKATVKEHKEALGDIELYEVDDVSREFIIPDMARELLAEDVSPNEPGLPDSIYQPDVVVIPTIPVKMYIENCPEHMRTDKYFHGQCELTEFFSTENAEFFEEMVLNHRDHRDSMAKQAKQREQRIKDLRAMEIDECKLDPFIRQRLEAKVDMDAIKREREAGQKRFRQRVEEVGLMKAKEETFVRRTPEEIEKAALEDREAMKRLGLHDENGNPTVMSTVSFLDETGKSTLREFGIYSPNPDLDPTDNLRPYDTLVRIPRDGNTYTKEDVAEFTEKAAQDPKLLETAPHYLAFHAGEELGLAHVYMLRRQRELDEEDAAALEADRKVSPMLRDHAPEGFLDIPIDPKVGIFSEMVHFPITEGSVAERVMNMQKPVTGMMQQQFEPVPHQHVQPEVVVNQPVPNEYEQAANELIAEDNARLAYADERFAVGSKFRGKAGVLPASYRDNGLRPGAGNLMNVRPNGRIVPENDKAVEAGLHLNTCNNRAASIETTRSQIEEMYKTHKSCPFVDNNGTLVTCEDGNALIITHKGLMDKPSVEQPLTYDAFGMPNLVFIEDGFGYAYTYSPVEKFLNGVPLEQIHAGIPPEYIRVNQQSVNTEEQDMFNSDAGNQFGTPGELVQFGAAPQVQQSASQQQMPAWEVSQNNEQMRNVLMTNLQFNNGNVIAGECHYPINSVVYQNLGGQLTAEAYISAICENDSAMTELGRPFSSPEGMFNAMVDCIEANPMHYVQSVYHFQQTNQVNPKCFAYDFHVQNSPAQQPEPQATWEPKPEPASTAPVLRTKHAEQPAPVVVEEGANIILESNKMTKEQAASVNKDIPTSFLLLGGLDGNTTFCMEQHYTAHYVLNNKWFVQPSIVKSAPLEANKIKGNLNYNAETHTVVSAYDQDGALVELLVLKENAMDYDVHAGIQRIYMDESKGEGDVVTLKKVDDYGDDDSTVKVDVFELEPAVIPSTYAEAKVELEKAKEIANDNGKYVAVPVAIKELSIGGTRSFDDESIELVKTQCKKLNGTKVNHLILTLEDECSPEYAAELNRFMTKEFNQFVAVHTEDDLAMTNYSEDWDELVTIARENEQDHALVVEFSNYLAANFSLTLTDPKPNAFQRDRDLARRIELTRVGKIVDLGFGSDRFQQGKIAGEHLRPIYHTLTELSDKLTQSVKGERLMLMTEFGRVFHGGIANKAAFKDGKPSLVKTNRVTVAELATLTTLNGK